MAEWIGRTLSKVEIQKLLGRGGMAAVYLGRHTTLNRPVAVKVLHSYLVEDPQLLERFRNEARAVAALRHPNIVQVFDFDVVDGSPYIIMELLEGRSLADYLQAQKPAGRVLPPVTTARIIADVATALDYAHARGIVHRDIKPENIMLRRAGGAIDPAAPLPSDTEAVLTDFGIARIADASARTVAGTIAGTPAYMSPEQAQGLVVDGRSDIYSLGIVVYEMLTGHLPFAQATETPASVLVKHITTLPPNLPCNCPELQAVMDRVLAKDREARYQTAVDFAIELQKALGIVTTLSRTRTLQPVHATAMVQPQSVRLQPAAPIPWLTIAGVGLVLVLLLVAALSFAGAAVIMGPRLLAAKPTGTSPAAGAQGLGNFAFRSGAGHTDSIIISAQLPPLASNQQYKVWLLSRDRETREAIGYLGADGRLDYVDPAGRNLLSTFDSFEITVQPKPDSNPNPSGDLAAHNALPLEALAHIRHVLSSFSSTPGQIGLGVGLLNDAEILNQTALDMQNAQQQGDLAGMHQDAEALVNVIVGQGSADYGDLDGNGKVVDPSDGFGLLLNGASPGYIEGTSDHAKLAADSPDATPNVKLHAGHVEICAQNLSEWAAQLRDLGKQIAHSPDTQSAASNVAKAVSLSKTFLNGQDLDGDESIDPVKGEGGAKTAIEHAEYMADLPLLSGKNQIP
jgi:tRNA A-37 threonylcarbamoyl transferase component Bud32